MNTSYILQKKESKSQQNGYIVKVNCLTVVRNLKQPELLMELQSR